MVKVRAERSNRTFLYEAPEKRADGDRRRARPQASGALSSGGSPINSRLLRVSSLDQRLGVFESRVVPSVVRRRPHRPWDPAVATAPPASPRAIGWPQGGRF